MTVSAPNVPRPSFRRREYCCTLQVRSGTCRVRASSATRRVGSVTGHRSTVTDYIAGTGVVSEAIDKSRLNGQQVICEKKRDTANGGHLIEGK